jgi:hypothetical protein
MTSATGSALQSRQVFSIASKAAVVGSAAVVLFMVRLA